MIVIHRPDRSEHLTRIDQLIEKYRAAKQRRIVRRAKRLWRALEARQRLAALETPSETIH